MDPNERAAIPVLEEGSEAPWAEFGVAYERRVVARLAREQTVLMPGASQSGLSQRRAVAFLRGETQAVYAAQVNLKPEATPSMLGNIPGLRVRRTFTDLVHRLPTTDKRSRFRIIDVKATRASSTIHKAQVAFYARMLEAVFREIGANAIVDDIGSIWRIPDDGDAQGDAWQEDQFGLKPYLRMVDEFCTRALPDIAKKRVLPGVDETFFHVYFKCEQCSYLSHCGRSIANSKPALDRDVSAVAGLSHEGKRTLHRVGIRTVADLARATSLRQIDGAGWSLSRLADLLVERAQSLSASQIRRTSEQHTFLMPPRVDVGFYLVADHDPIDDALVTLGYLRVQDGHPSEMIDVLERSDSTAEADALVRIFGRLIADLEAIDQTNRDGGIQTYCHIFFYEATEAVYLQNAVKRHLADPRVRGGLLHMVRLFPPDDVVPEPEFRGQHHLPATAVRSVMERLYAVPATVSYDLRQVSAALLAQNAIKVGYDPASPFRREFSSLLSVDVSRGLREGRQTGVSVDDVRADVRSRLRATHAIVEWLLKENSNSVRNGTGPLLRLAKKPFELQASFDPLNAQDLDVLRAMEVLESRSGMLETLVRLAQPERARREQGRAVTGMRLRRRFKTGAFYVLEFDVPIESREAELGPDTIGIVLTDDDADLRLNPARWRDVSCRIEGWSTAGIVRVSMHRGVFEGPIVQQMLRRSGDRGWCLDEVFVDLNAPRAERFLVHLSQGETLDRS